MARTSLQTLGILAVLVIAAAGGWLATNRFQATVPIVPGIQGCWRLEGSARQTSCLSEEFEQGAERVAGRATGRAREDAVIGYVRRVERLAAQDQQLAGTCHQAMHGLGRQQGAAAARADRVPRFPDASTQLCTAGYVHGLAEGYVAGSPAADLGAVFNGLCHDASARAGCAHGLGHALVREQKRNDWTAVAKHAVARCSSLPAQAPDSCRAGVFMEIAMRSEPAPVPTEQFVRTCAAADVDVALTCWPYLGTSLTTNDAPIETMPSWCARAPLSARFECIDGYGRSLGARRVDRCASSSRALALRERCIDGAIALQVGSGHISARDARRECGSLRGEGLRSYCTGAVTRYSRGRAKVESAT